MITVVLDDKSGVHMLGNANGAGYFHIFDWITVHKLCISQHKKKRSKKKTSGLTLQSSQGICSQQLGLFQKTGI